MLVILEEHQTKETKITERERERARECFSRTDAEAKRFSSFGVLQQLRIENVNESESSTFCYDIIEKNLKYYTVYQIHSFSFTSMHTFVN